MNATYPLFPVLIVLLLAFFTTLGFTGWKIVSVTWHRKFWNYLLLIFFLISGLLGLFSVVKINYKLEIPGYEQYLHWHVSFGIAMIVVAFFHLLWHMNYYFPIRKKTKKRISANPIILETGKLQFKVLLFLLGVVAIISQVIFIREFMGVLAGNELVVGVVLAAWMLLTGWGALHARKGIFPELTLIRGISMLLTLTLAPMVLLYLLFVLKNMLFPPGTIVGLSYTMLASFALLFPVCFLSGYLFTVLSTLYSTKANKNLVGKSYAVESFGSLVGGALFTLVLGRFFNAFQAFSIIAAIVFLTGVWMLPKPRKRLMLLIPALLIPAITFIYNPEKRIKKILFPNQELLKSQSTPYGNLVITRQAEQINVYENSNLLFYTHNVMMNEEAVHFSMVQHKNPKNILLISGGIAGMIDEILKYEVDKITYLEPNPAIFRLAVNYEEALPGLEKLKIIKKDIRRFIGKTNNLYDVILINLPPPSSLGLNRFYTEEFFSLLKKHCTPETVVITTLPSSVNYAEEHALLANSSLWKTMGLFFENQLLLSGEKNYFLASDSPLMSNIVEKIAVNNIRNDYVNQYYFDDRLFEQRSKSIAGQFHKSVPVNRDFYPYIFMKEISSWLSLFGTGYRLIVVLPVLLFVFFFFKTNRITAGLYSGGFTATSLEITLLLAYQVYFGSIYLASALFFAVFMAGLAFGSSLSFRKKIEEYKSYYRLQFGLALFAVILPFLIQIRGVAAGTFALQLLFIILVFLLSTAIGFEFLLASKIRSHSYSETSGTNYSTDLAGSAFGAFLTPIVLLPLLGMVNTCLVVAGLNILSGTLAYLAQNQKAPV